MTHPTPPEAHHLVTVIKGDGSNGRGNHTTSLNHGAAGGECHDCGLASDGGGALSRGH